MKYDNRKKETRQGFYKEKDLSAIPLSSFEVTIDPRKELLAVGIEAAQVRLFYLLNTRRHVNDFKKH